MGREGVSDKESVSARAETGSGQALAGHRGLCDEETQPLPAVHSSPAPG